MEMAHYALVSTPRELYLAGPSFDDLTPNEESKDIGGTTSPAWRAVLDEASGNIYYWDPTSGATCWDPPLATMDEEDISFRLGSAKSENSFATGENSAAGPNNEHTTISLISTTTPAHSLLQNFEQVRKKRTRLRSRRADRTRIAPNRPAFTPCPLPPPFRLRRAGRRSFPRAS